MNQATRVTRAFAAIAVVLLCAACASNAPPSGSYSREDAMQQNEKRRLMNQTSSGQLCSQKPGGMFAGMPN